jgi:rod shape-determining protein MreC
MLEKRPNWSNRIALSLLILISVAVVIVHFRENENGFLHRVQKSAMGLLTPIQSGTLSSVRFTTNLWESITQFGRLKSDNQRLTKEVAALRRQSVVSKELELENERLLKLLGAPARRDYQTLYSNVIGKSVNSWQATIILDKGMNDGVKKHMAVAMADGLVGQVISVSKTSCLVQLITDQKCAVGVRLQSNRAIAVVEGQGGKELDLTLLPREIPATKGELVLTAGIGGVYPPDIVVGTISYVVAKPQGIYQEARVSPAVDFWTLEEVFIITGLK